MKKLFEFPFDDGDCILVEVEVEDVVEPGMFPVARDSKKESLPVKAAMTFDAAIDKVKPIAISFVKKLRGISDPPDEMEVEFGLKLSADAGVIVASAGMEANYSVKLVWKRKTLEKENP